MTPMSEDFLVRRILVALDSASLSDEMLEVAATLAAAMDADLTGLFIEDEDLLGLGGLDFVRQIDTRTGLARAIDTASMERELRAQASRARRRLEESATLRQVTWSFRVVRGRVQSAVAEAAGEADLVVLESAARPIARHLHLGAPCRTAWRFCRSALVLRAARPLAAPVAVLYDGSAAAGRAVAAAARLAADLEGGIVVLLAPERPGQVETLAGRVRDMLVDRDIAATYIAVPRDDAAALVRAAGEAGGGVLVVAGETPMLEGAAGEHLVDHAPCPVLFTR